MAFYDYLDNIGKEDYDRMIVDLSSVYGVSSDIITGSVENEFDPVISNMQENGLTWAENSLSLINEGSRGEPRFVVVNDMGIEIGRLSFNKEAPEINPLRAVFNEDASYTIEAAKDITADIKTDGRAELEKAAETLITTELIDERRESLSNAADLVNAAATKNEFLKEELPALPKDFDTGIEDPVIADLSMSEKQQAIDSVKEAAARVSHHKLSEKLGEIKDEIEGAQLDILNARDEQIKALSNPDIDQNTKNEIIESTKEKIKASNEQIENLRKEKWETIKDAITSKINQFKENIQKNFVVFKVANAAKIIRAQALIKLNLVAVGIKRVNKAIKDFEKRVDIKVETRNAVLRERIRQEERISYAANYYTERNQAIKIKTMEMAINKVFEKDAQIRGFVKNIGNILNHKEWENAEYTKLQQKILDTMNEKVAGHIGRMDELGKAFNDSLDESVKDIRQVTEDRYNVRQENIKVKDNKEFSRLQDKINKEEYITSGKEELIRSLREHREEKAKAYSEKHPEKATEKDDSGIDFEASMARVEKKFEEMKAKNKEATKVDKKTKQETSKNKGDEEVRTR